MPRKHFPQRSVGKRAHSERRRVLTLVGFVSVLALLLLGLWLWGRSARWAARTASSQPDASPDAAPFDELPETPSREEVRGPLRALSPLISACNEKGRAGVLRVHLTIKGKTGAVSHATVAKQFSGTEVADCAVRIVERAQFPRFRKTEFTVVYPYTLVGAATDAGLGDSAGETSEP